MRGTDVGRGVRALAVGLGSAMLVGCLGAMEPEAKPTEARVRVDGTAPAALELVVSRDFYQIQDAVTLETVEVIEQADTTLITPPYDETIPLDVGGSVLVNLANHEDTPANVRLRVDLNAGQAPYDRSATMSEGGSLRYVFLFREIG